MMLGVETMIWLLDIIMCSMTSKSHIIVYSSNIIAANRYDMDMILSIHIVLFSIRLFLYWLLRKTYIPSCATSSKKSAITLHVRLRCTIPPCCGPVCAWNSQILSLGYQIALWYLYLAPWYFPLAP